MKFINIGDFNRAAMNPHDRKTTIASTAIAKSLCSQARIVGYEIGVGDRIVDAIVRAAIELPDIGIETQHKHKQKDIVETTKNHLRNGLNVVWVATKDSQEWTRIRTELEPYVTTSPTVTTIDDQTVEIGDIIDLRKFDYRVESVDEIGLKPALYRIKNSVVSAYRTDHQIHIQPIEGPTPIRSETALRSAIKSGNVERLSPNGTLAKL